MAFKSLTGFDANSKVITNVADPSAATDASNKQYVDNTAAGLSWKVNARVASTANIAIASALTNGSSIDGVSVATGDRVLLKNQSAPAENGLYAVVASGAASRTTDANTAALVKNLIVRISEGTVNGDTMWQMVTDGAITLNTTALTFTQFTGGGGTYTADGQGIEVSANQFALELDGTSLSKSASGVRIGTAAAASGLTESSGLLSVGAGTGITVNANDVAVDVSVVVRKYAADCAATTNPQTFTHNLNTLDVEVWLREVSTGIFVLADFSAPTVNTVSVNFGGAPTAAQWRAIVFG